MFENLETRTMNCGMQALKVNSFRVSRARSHYQISSPRPTTASVLCRFEHMYVPKPRREWARANVGVSAHDKMQGLLHFTLEAPDFDEGHVDRPHPVAHALFIRGLRGLSSPPQVPGTGRKRGDISAGVMKRAIAVLAWGWCRWGVHSG